MLGRLASLDGAQRASDLLADDSPRTPYAAVAYARGRGAAPRAATRSGLAALVAGCVLLLLLLGAAAPGGRRGGAAAGESWPAAAPGVAYGPPRYVLVLDCGSSGSRM
jgi:hypothetical protein